MRVQIFQEFPQNIIQHPRWQALTWSTSGNFWDSRLGKTLRYSVHTALLILIALSLLSLWPRKATVSNRAVASTPMTQAAPGTWANKIVAAHLFGQAQQKPVVAAAMAVSITVEGLAAASNPNDSVAILTLNGKTDEFHVDAVLPDGEKLTAIDPDGVELADGSNVRRIALATYGTPDSEGPAAYAALLHGVGLSIPGNSVDGKQTTPGTLAAVGITENTEPSFLARPIAVLNSTPASAMHIVHIPAQATPLEQLQALRTQLIHQ